MNILKVLAVSLFVVSSSYSFAQEKGIIEVVGEAKEVYAPDQAVFNFNVSATKKSEAESQLEMIRVSTILQERLMKLGFTKEQLKLTDYSIDQDYDYSGPKMKILGYKAYQNFELKFPIDKERILKVFETVTFEQNKGIEATFSTSTSDSLLKVIENRLIVAVLKDAREKGELIAKNINCKIVSVSGVSMNVEGLRPMVRQLQFSEPVFAADDSDKKLKISDSFSIADDLQYKKALVKYIIVNN